MMTLRKLTEEKQMNISEFKNDEFFSMRSTAVVWGRPAVIYVEFDGEHDYYEALAGFIEIISGRVAWLDENRAEVLAQFRRENIAERAGLDEKAAEERAFVSELTVYCDDGVDNVWINAFVEFGEGAPAVQIAVSPAGEVECSGICG